MDDGSGAVAYSGLGGLTTGRAVQVLEAALLTAGRPLPLETLGELFNNLVGPDTLRSCLDTLAADWQGRGFQLRHVAGGWTVMAEQEIANVLSKLVPQRAPRYSKAVIETLTVIAYQQPVTRAEIEAVRGVGVGTNVLKQLEDRGWIEVVGQQDVPGRPSLWATTNSFLEYMGTKSVDELYLPMEEAEPVASTRQEFRLASVHTERPEEF